MAEFITVNDNMNNNESETMVSITYEDEPDNVEDELRTKSRDL